MKYSNIISRLVFTFLSCIFFVDRISAQQSNSFQKLPIQVQKELGNVVYFKGGTFMAGSSTGDFMRYPLFANEEDTFLLFMPTTARRMSMEDFYLGETEVTNKQYKEFVAWVRDSVAHCQMDHIYVDEKGKQRVDWKKPLDWKVGGPLDGMFYTMDKQLADKRNLDVSKLIYQFQIYGMTEDGRLNVQELIDGLTSNEKQYTKRSIKIYPDTLSWIRDCSYSYNEPMVRNYFNHPAFEDFPVVGMTWEQAMAYCDWKTSQVNAILSKQGLKPVSVRLPYEYEWEFAACKLEEDSDLNSRYSDYPWEGGFEVVDNKGNYKANFGTIEDYSGIQIKSFNEVSGKGLKTYPRKILKSKYNINEGLYTCKVKSFPPFNKVYDMAGNVAEWTMDIPTITNYCQFMDSLKDEEFAKKINAKLNLSIDPKNLYNYFETEIIHADSIQFSGFMKAVYSEKFKDDFLNIEYDNTFVEYIMEKIIHLWRELKIIKNSDTKRITKGGSWASGLAHILRSSRAAYSSNMGRSYLGFRIAVTGKMDK